MNRLRSSIFPAVFGLLAVCFCAPFAAEAQPTRADAEKDPVLKAMLTELDRSMSQLQLPGFAKPFFIQYRIEEIDDFQTKGSSGRAKARNACGSAWRG